MSSTKISERASRNDATFFVWTFVLSIPFYILGTIAPQEMDVPVSILITFVPMISALVLTLRQNASREARALLRRSFDFKRIARKRWYAAILLIMPVVYLVVLWTLGLIEGAPGESVFPLVMAPVLLIMFFLMALGEEVGWIGYAYDPMEERWNASKAGLILGIIWAAWHIPLYIFVVEQALLWAAGQLVVLIGLRIFLVWIYNNTGKSLFAVILCHAVSNLPPAALPVYESPLGPVITAVLLTIIVVIITRVWDSQTLSQLRKD